MCILLKHILVHLRLSLNYQNQTRTLQGAYTRDAGEVLIVVLTIVEEAGHSLGQHLTVVGDEALLGATCTFAGEQGADGETTEDVQNNILYEVGQCVPVVEGHLHFEEPVIVIV